MWDFGFRNGDFELRICVSPIDPYILRILFSVVGVSDCEFWIWDYGTELGRTNAVVIRRWSVATLAPGAEKLDVVFHIVGGLGRYQPQQPAHLLSDGVPFASTSSAQG